MGIKATKLEFVVEDENTASPERLAALGAIYTIKNFSWQWKHFCVLCGSVDNAVEHIWDLSEEELHQHALIGTMTPEEIEV